jgi:hypothetical protein
MIFHPLVLHREIFKEIETHYPKPDKKWVLLPRRSTRVMICHGQFQEKILTVKHIITEVGVEEIILIHEAHQKLIEEILVTAQTVIQTHCPDLEEVGLEEGVSMIPMDHCQEEEEDKKIQKVMGITEEIMTIEVIIMHEVEEEGIFKDRLAHKGKLIHKNISQEPQVREE